MDMINGNEKFHSVGVAIVPRRGGTATWSVHTLRYKSGGRVPVRTDRIGGELVLADNPSEQELLEALRVVIESLTGGY